MDDVTSALSLYPVHSNTTEKAFNSLGEKPHWQHSVILKWIEETRQLSGKKRANLMARKQSVHCIMLMEFIWRKRRRSEADPATCSVGLLLFEGSFGHIRAPWLKGFRSVGTNRRGPGKMLGAVKWGQGWQGERGPCHSMLSCWSGKVESTVSYKNSALFLWEKGTSYLNALTVVNTIPGKTKGVNRTWEHTAQCETELA
ncbi:hypothetical protein T4E_8182 [Trichinella pseudospiralis]|uniref:Uncharacterized protein n=1 Tax=Trichinella pseudospiralis TaxID=6337 RepID=A0A0V0XN37_TRIPS|nr:hypothetical protein T4E_8182 [Trichinella pseudospiralis]